jgi:hypothetical protein
MKRLKMVFEDKDTGKIHTNAYGQAPDHFILRITLFDENHGLIKDLVIMDVDDELEKEEEEYPMRLFKTKEA